MKNTEIFKRFTAESPAFFKRITAFSLTLGAAGTAILTVPAIVAKMGVVINLPAYMTTAAGYMVAVGAVAAAISKTTVENKEDLK